MSLLSDNTSFVNIEIMYKSVWNTKDTSFTKVIYFHSAETCSMDCHETYLKRNVNETTVLRTKYQGDCYKFCGFHYDY